MWLPYKLHDQNTPIYKNLKTEYIKRFAIVLTKA